MTISYAEIINEIYVEEISNEAFTLAKEYGYLPYMVQRYIDMIGVVDTEKLLNAFEHFSYTPAILCNHIHVDCNQLVDRLKELGFILERIPWCENCYKVVSQPKSPSLGSTHEFLKGLYYVYRDASSLVPPLVLNPLYHTHVLDMCAAPGGKTVHILLLINDMGVVVANDISPKRGASLLSNLYRMGFKSHVVLAENAIKLPEKVDMKFDYILLDAPCSAEGAIMFDRKRKTKTSQQVLAKLVKKEIELLYSASKLVKPGGAIVYSTCSIAPEENEYVITKILERLNNIEIAESPLNLWSKGLLKFRELKFDGAMSKCIRIWPHVHGMEGYFVCLLRRR
ncbi:MAG: RsmB/NOP family class I SAM-dependent RNA methyltransferase [Sulfolobales archaeon]|nr:RsmB/NOP family class I SAM-dependent RNA methyltransferase [Sulfolobales archaeon]